MSKALYDVTGGTCRKVKKLYGVVPTSAGTSKNLLPVYDLWLGNSYGISCVRNADGSIHVSGTAESDSTVYILAPDYCLHLPEGYYTLSMGGTMPEGINIIFEYYDETGTGWLGNLGTVDNGNLSATGQIGATNSPSIYIRVYEGYSVDVTLYPQLEAGSEATDYVPYGEVTEGRTRKIKKSYDVVGGVTRQFYSAEFLTYDGAYTVSQVTYDGKLCNLYTLTGSGILTLNDDALFWMCGGGGAGGFAKVAQRKYGAGGGGGGYVSSGDLVSGTHTIVIGSGGTSNGTSSNAGGTSQIGSLSAAGGNAGSSIYNGTGGAGGSGGGAGGNGSAGTGAAISTYPFSDSVNFKRHCPGGGGGGYYGGSYYYTGGAGGTNGSHGKASSKSTSSPAYGGSGGVYGGGAGSKAASASTLTDGGNASFFGGGGGGCGCSTNSATPDSGKGGSGSQGVVYILDYKGGVAV